MTPHKPMSDKPSVRSPWFWVPSLYFAQGIPYVAVMIVSVLMYRPLYELAELALGDQAFLEPFRGFAEDQTLVGGHHAAIDRGRACRGCVYDPDDILFPGFIGGFLVAGFQFRHA